MVMPDADFELQFGPVWLWVEQGRTGNWTELRWQRAHCCAELTRGAWEVLGVNVDFQIYPESWSEMTFMSPRLLVVKL